MSKIVELMSGGQSGADRGAMDAARKCGVAVGGWCPAGGWAEDLPEPPGIRALYPQMKETPLSDVSQRTEWNIRDSSCCMVLNASEKGVSPGTDIGFALYEKYGKPHFEIEIGGEKTVDEQLADAFDWVRSLDDDAIAISFGGPRASEFPGVYDIAFHVVEELLAEFA